MVEPNKVKIHKVKIRRLNEQVELWIESPGLLSPVGIRLSLEEGSEVAEALGEASSQLKAGPDIEIEVRG